MAVFNQKDFDAELGAIKASGEAPSLLLHACCAPCASYVLEYLSQYFEITVLFYNPNITDKLEYQKRAGEFNKLLRYTGLHRTVSFIDCGYEPEVFRARAQEYSGEPEGGQRCEKCFWLRLEETAKRAKAGGFEYFATTLSVSPHKNVQMLNEIGSVLEVCYNVKYLVSDFKKRDGYKRSVYLARLLGLYRQSYCGCEYSI